MARVQGRPPRAARPARGARPPWWAPLPPRLWVPLVRRVLAPGVAAVAGALAAATVISFADYSGATTEQKSKFVFFADRASMTIGATSDRAWEYAEP